MTKKNAREALAPVWYENFIMSEAIGLTTEWKLPKRGFWGTIRKTIRRFLKVE